MAVSVHWSVRPSVTLLLWMWFLALLVPQVASSGVLGMHSLSHRVKMDKRKKKKKMGVGQIDFSASRDVLQQVLLLKEGGKVQEKSFMFEEVTQMVVAVWSRANVHLVDTALCTSKKDKKVFD